MLPLSTAVPTVNPHTPARLQRRDPVGTVDAAGSQYWDGNGSNDCHCQRRHVATEAIGKQVEAVHAVARRQVDCAGNDARDIAGKHDWGDQ